MIIAFPLLIATTGAVSAFLLAISFIPSRNPLAARIERMQAVAERAHDVRLKRFEEIITGEPLGKLRARLVEAGWYNVTPAAFALRGFAGLGIGFCVGLLLFQVLPNKSLAALGGLSIALAAWRLPKISLDRAIKTRKTNLERALPDFLDLLSATVGAGLALNAAMIQATDAAIEPLQGELNSALAEIRLGRSRTDALQSMAERVNEPQISTMVMSINQAEVLGSNVSTTLHELAIDARHRRWTLAEERAAKLPIKMMIPMGLLMMPSLYVMIFGPVAANVLRTLTK